MNCPNCDRYTPDNSPVCVHCGAELPALEASSPKHPGSSRSSGNYAKSGGGKVPSPLLNRNIVIITVICIVGILLFFMLRSHPQHAYVTEFPDGPIDLSSMVVSGKTNIVDMYSEFCPPCRAIAPYLEKLAKARSDIHVIRIDINRKGHRGIDWASPIAKQFGLRSIPHFIIVDGNGKVLEEGKSAYKEVVKMIKAALRQ